MAEFSAKFYQDMSEDEFRAAAKEHRIEYIGPRNNELVDRVYNAELQRRHDEARKQRESEQNAAAKSAPSSAVKADVMHEDAIAGLADDDAELADLDTMTKAQLKAYAAERDIDLGDATNNDDIRAAIRGAEGK